MFAISLIFMHNKLIKSWTNTNLIFVFCDSRKQYKLIKQFRIKYPLLLSEVELNYQRYYNLISNVFPFKDAGAFSFGHFKQYVKKITYMIYDDVSMPISIR